MDKFFLTVVNMSLTGAFVILAVCFFRILLRRAPKIISYYLWVVVGFRLLFPSSIESVFSLVPFNAQLIPLDITTQTTQHIDGGVMITHNWVVIGQGIWITGVSIFILYGLVSYIYLRRKMQEAIYIEKNIYEADIMTPFILGFFAPKIFIPSLVNEYERSYIILHEQIHVQRYDHIIKLMAYLILCLHWFNLFVWLAFFLMSADMEMSCDERVINEMGGKERKDYSLSLLFLATGSHNIGASPIAFGEGNVKKRVKNVLEFQKKSRTIIISSSIIAIVLGMGLIVNRVQAVETITTNNNLTNTSVIYSTESIESDYTSANNNIKGVKEEPGISALASETMDSNSMLIEHIIEPLDSSDIPANISTDVIHEEPGLSASE